METGANPGSLGLAMRQSPPMKNIVILISGGGSNMAAIVRASQQQNWAKQYNARVAAVVSNKADAKGLVFARDNGIATELLDHKQFDSREAFDAELAQVIDRYAPDLVVLAAGRRTFHHAAAGLYEESRDGKAQCRDVPPAEV